MTLRTDTFLARAYPDLGARIDTIATLIAETFPLRQFELEAQTREANAKAYGGPTPRQLVIEIRVEMPESPKPPAVSP